MLSYLSIYNMKSNPNLENFKNKKDLIAELGYYKSIIQKKMESGEYNSALEKVQSALILLEEHQDFFNVKKEFLDFSELYNHVKEELATKRMIYERRFNNLLREELNEANLENFSKLLVMLKSDVSKYNLNDINSNITKYFKYIKKLYEILSCYKTINYYDASKKIFNFVRDVKPENFPNLKLLISSIYQEKLVDFIHLVKKLPKSPVKDYNSRTNEITFR